MNYYDYAKTLSAEGNMTALIGGGSGTEPETDYVDLGLSVKWAKCNIGANTPEEAGLYFAWGETSGYAAEQVGNEEGKRAFAGDDYEFGPFDLEDETNYGMTKYNSNGPTVLESEDDAASEIWKNGWRMPTKLEFEELLENTTSAWTEVNGVYGAMFTSTVDGYTGNSLFFPAVGSAGNGEVYDVGGNGYYWSASLVDDGVGSAWILGFNDGFCEVYNINRCSGCSVRPVLPQNL